jgi:hypothetical protein
MQASSAPMKNLFDRHVSFEKTAFHRPVLKMKQGKKIGPRLTAGVDNLSQTPPYYRRPKFAAT